MGSASKQLSVQAAEEGTRYLDAGSDKRATINGRPLLSAAAIQQWFIDAKIGEPSLKAVLPIAEAINHLDLFRAFWSDDPIYRDWQSQNPSRLAQERIASAIVILCEELPRQLQHLKLLDPDGYDEVAQLFNIAQRWQPHLKTVYGSKKLGRCKCKWHNVARNLKKLLREAMEQSGLKNCGFATPTSKGLLLLQAALSHLGVLKSNDQIVEALRSPRTRVRPLGK